MSWERTTKSFIDLFHGVQRGDYNLDPEHQRDVVHDDTWQSGIINSALGIGDIPQVYFHKVVYEDGSSCMESLDGKQRCSAICRFLNNKYKFKPNAKVWDVNQSIVGKSYQQLTQPEKQRVDRCVIECKVYSETLTPELIGNSSYKGKKQKKLVSGNN